MKLFTRSYYGVLICLLTAVVTYGSAGAQEVDAAGARSIRPLVEGWKFVQDDALAETDALAATAEDWETINLPHTWNAEDAASLVAGDYVRGIGWYRLEFDSPTEGARHWLEFGAASLVADVWLNGQHLGQHRGGFTAFRFDVTDVLVPAVDAPDEAGGGTEGGMANVNAMLVKVDNREPVSESDPTAIPPLGGDYNKAGGLYRHVNLISTASPVHFALDDLGGPGVYATTTTISSGAATIDVRSKLTSMSASDGDYLVRTTLLDESDETAASAENPVQLAAGAAADAMQQLEVPSPRLWHGKADPYLYRFVAELLDGSGVVVDRVEQRFGIREMRFDPNEGFFLNGEPMRLHGVAMHQDYLGKAWAISNEEIDTSLALIMEMGANAVRLGHYPFPDYALERVSELGLIVWAEKPSGLRTTVSDCTADVTPEFLENAKLQTREMIRRQFNHAAVAVWSVANETSGDQLMCEEPHDNVTPYLRALHEVVQEEDPNRPSAYAEFSTDAAFGAEPPFSVTGITDILGTNRYYLWYTPAFDEFPGLLERLHTDNPDQPIGVSEYGAGAALTHHTDNPLGGPVEATSAPEGAVSYQPEEYAAYFHEQNYRVISSVPYLWGSFAWNMFDFGSANRNEGDVLGVNTKGLVTFDRQTRKDPFFFYKANWSDTPVTHIVGRRHTERAYPLTDVKVYSNADSVELAVNGIAIAALTGDQCEQMTCVFEDITLSEGVNTVSAAGNHGDEFVTDSVEWTLSDASRINIDSGRLASGYVASDGARFGSDDFFSGGEGSHTRADLSGGIPEFGGTSDPFIFAYFRLGNFGYEIPLADGRYSVTLGFLESDDAIEVGGRVFDVNANGTTVIDDLDVLAETGAHQTALTRTFPVDVTVGVLMLEFVSNAENAMVSNIRIAPAE